MPVQGGKGAVHPCMVERVHAAEMGAEMAVADEIRQGSLDMDGHEPAMPGGGGDALQQPVREDGVGHADAGGERL